MMSQTVAEQTDQPIKPPPTWAIRASMAVAVILGILIFVTLGAFGFMLVRKIMGKDDLPMIAENSAKPARSAKAVGRVVRQPWPQGARPANITTEGERMLVRFDLENGRSGVWIINLDDGRVLAEYGDHITPEPEPAQKTPKKAKKEE